MRRIVRALCVGTLLGALGLSGCVPGAAPEPSSPLVGIGKPVRSPSGTFTAVIEKVQDSNGSYLIPTIQTSAGAAAFTDQKYSARHRLLVMWQAKDDVLWVYSGDVGTSRLEQVGGTWTKTQTTQNMPAEVREEFGR